MILFDGRSRSRWSNFHGKSEAQQLQLLGDGFGFIVRPGDVYGSGERAELMASSASLPFPIGRDVWMGLETTFPADFLAKAGTNWNIFAQLHQTGPSGSPNVDYSVDTTSGDEILELTVRGGDVAAPVKASYGFGVLERDKPYRVVTRVRWGPDKMGFIEAWVNGERICPLVETPTLYIAQGVYLKHGFYRGAWNQITRVVHRKAVVADRLEDVRGILG